jgi:hypothetical protein
MGKVHEEDFAQFTGASRESKYGSSLERVAKVVEEFCKFPALEKAKLARGGAVLLFDRQRGHASQELIVHDERRACVPSSRV